MAEIGIFPMFSMVTSWILLVFARDQTINQESMLMAECIRDSVPTQIYLTCCVRENNCTLERQQIKGIECISRHVANESMMESRESGSSESSSTIRGDRYSSGEVMRRITENCRRLPRLRQMTCIRSELTKRCREAMSEFRPRQGGRRRLPTSVGALWDSPYMSEIYPLDRSRIRDSVLGEGLYYPSRLYGSRRLYGMGSRGLGRLEGGSRMYSSSYGDSSDEDEEGFGYESRMEEPYSRYK